MRGVFITATAALLVLSSTSVLAALEQMDATDPPSVEGPLTLEDEKCDRKARTSEGEKVAVIKRCLRFYRFDQATESDAARDYGVVWLQSNVDARNGWCTKRASSDILLPADVGLGAFRPRRLTEVAKTRSITTTLVADAEGAASVEGRVSQDWMAFPTQFRGVMREENTVFRVKWRGNSKAKLAFAGGIEISWDPATPPEGLSYQLNFALGNPDAC